MNAYDRFFVQTVRRNGLLIDANVLTLFVVGSVAPERIADFKRTKMYDRAAYDLLLGLLAAASPPKIFATPHVFAEVSNLTDMKGRDLSRARTILSTVIEQTEELSIASRLAARHEIYGRLGLTDAGIAVTAAEHGFAVLTDDLDLYLALTKQGAAVEHFTHLRAAATITDDV